MVGIDFSGVRSRKTDDFSGVLWFDTESLLSVRSVQTFKSKAERICIATETAKLKDWMGYCVCIFLCRPYAVTVNQTISVLITEWEGGVAR